MLRWPLHLRAKRVRVNREDNAKGAAYRDLRNWKAGYLAALNGGLPYPEYVAQQFVESFNAKRAELLTQFN